jgi:hypothetical protein
MWDVAGDALSQVQGLGNWNVLDMVIKPHFDTLISCLSKQTPSHNSHARKHVL